MNAPAATYEELAREVAELRTQLAEGNDILRAIRSGEVDAVLAEGPRGDQLFTLRGADDPYRVLIEEMNQGAVTLSADGSILYANRRFAELLKSPLEEIVGCGFATFVSPEERAAFLLLLGEGLDGATAAEITLRASDRSSVPLQLALGPLPAQSAAAVCLVATDISESREKESHLRAAMTALIAAKIEAEKARAEAERANRAKSEFLANMSHEIRTPMNGVLGMTDLALESSLTEEQRSYLTMAQASGHALLRLINDILDFSKIEAGKLSLESIHFSLRHCVGGMLKPLAVRAKQKGLDLVAEIPDDVPDHLIGDPTRLRQILINLTDNAIKFTARGQVRVHVRTEIGQEGEHCLHFSVADTGIGVPAEKQSAIFEAFAQADGSTTRTYGGTGLGLAIALQLVHQMRGRMWIESPPGSGATFHFTAWFGIADAPPSLLAADSKLTPRGPGACQPADLPSASLRILIAEDNPINHALAAGILEKRGHSLVHAANGLEAVEAAGREAFDLILMDVQMPLMDGFEATRRIREADQAGGRHTPIVAMTAHAMAGHRERCLAAGMDDYLSKPVQKPELFALLARTPAGRKPVVPVTPSEPPAESLPDLPPASAAPIPGSSGTPAENPFDLYTMIAWAAAGIAFLIGLCVLAGWLFDVRPLMTVLPGLVSMKPNTAVAFCLGGLSLLFAMLPSPGTHRRTRRISLSLAAATALLGALTLVEYLCGLNLRIDELLFTDYVRGSTGYVPGRMAPITAFNFTVLGLALILIHFPGKRLLAQMLTLGATLTSLLAVAGHFYGVASLYQSGSFTAVALHTAIAFLALATGLCCATSRDGFMRKVTDAGASGRMLRRYGLAGVFWPFLLSWLCLGGERQHWYGTDFSLAILGIANVVTFATIIWVAAGSVRRAEVKATLARERLRQAHDELETRVRERTSELARANADLQEQVQERTRAEHAYHQIMDHSLDVICTFDADGCFVQVSRACETVWGYRPEELAGRHFMEMVHPDDRQMTTEASASIASGAPVKNFENRYLRRDGTAVPIVWTATWSKENALMFCVARDITERKRAEESLRLLESALENITEAITITDADLDAPGPRIVFVNPAYTKMTGYTAAEAIGRNPRIMQGPRTDKAELSRLRRTLERGEVFEGETVNYRKDGTEFDLEWHVSPIRIGGGKVTHFAAVQRDTTERRRAERELLAAKGSAEAANRAKSEFLANMSHEIRTPMNGIIGMTDLVLETKLDREQREYLEMAKFSAETLLVLINDILDFSKIEAGKLELEVIPFSLRDCIGAMLKPLGLRADRKGLELTADIPAGVPDHLVGDPTRLRQILINLTDNAIKFTERGDVMLRVAFEPVADDGPYLHFSIADSGVGIPAAKQASIFEAFSQADGTTTRTHGGTGLGLAIVSQLVRQMGGTIWVESVVGEGATFHFTVRLPVRSGLAPSARHADPRRLEGVRVLVVDDNAVNRRILQESLLNWRMRPTTVASGAEALAEMLRAKRADEPFALVILDCLMPGMDGFMTAEKIRAQPELAGVALMMLTSAMLPGASARCLALGVASHLTKPALPSELLEAILLALGGTADHLIRTAAEAEPVEAATRGLCILVAEDNLINWALILGMLEKRGHSPVRAANGREAVDAVARGAFDLIFMDVQMPEMDGLEATRVIREDERAGGRKHTPIVAMTAHALTGDRERCLAVGMDDYLSKPVEKEALLAIIAHVASNSLPAPAPTVQSVPALPALPASPELAPGRNAPPVFRREIFLDQLDGDEALMEKMIRLLHENTPRQLDTIHGAIESGDWAGLARCAHGLRGSLGVFGAHDARALTQRLEDYAHAEAYADAGRTFADLAREMVEVQAALAGFLPSTLDPAVSQTAVPPGSRLALAET